MISNISPEIEAKVLSCVDNIKRKNIPKVLGVTTALVNYIFAKHKIKRKPNKYDKYGRLKETHKTIYHYDKD
ncbi:MAG: hypothetical protein CL596_05180 [Alteromonas sp.]|nr:hypothetical protein [Alteromonas sp.]|tara:strand:- start:14269 stop:14484 length:216 start_codon:yes stop_codon:yes gene_type:complete